MKTVLYNKPARGRRRSQALRLPLAATAALLLAGSAAGCGNSEPAPAETVTEIEEVRLDAIREIVPDADLEYKEVTVAGEVASVISPSAFSITDPDDPLVDDLLIVNDSGTGEVQFEMPVKVTGIVYRGFDVAEVEKETGISLDEALNEEWEGDSYIIASQVDAQ